MTLLKQQLLGKRIRLEKPELLAPAGSLEKLRFAVHYGADAVYIGGQQYGLRSSAGNFTFDEMREGVEFAKGYGAKVFVATNIYAHNEDIAGLEDYLRGIQDAGVAAIIVADPVIIETCKRVAPKLEIHLSTQQSTMNWQAIQFWMEEGVDRVVLAREASMQEIEDIKKNVNAEIEIFVHGAMCSSYSGRCVLSNHFTDRDSNRGGCSQSCRWKYDLFTTEQDQQAGIKELPLFQESDDAFTMGSKDLSMIEHVPELIRSGVDSFKIEGRMKSVHYVATVVNAYRQAIDAYFADPEHYEMKPEWAYEIQKAANRPLNSGFFYEHPDHEDHIFEPEEKGAPYDFVGVVTAYDDESGVATIQQRNHFKPGQEIEFFGPQGTFFKQLVPLIFDQEGQPLDAARHPLQSIQMKLEHPVKPMDMMRKRMSKA
jgi:putative protease